ncbi:MAG: hypothetical protein ACI92G_001088 [Candidatus Pelagisphaera sp.]|jgi:hypothetical protein
MEILISILASGGANVPDTGGSALLLGIAVIGLGAVARFTKNRKK